MTELIDSRKQQLTSKEILPIVYKSMSSSHPFSAVLPAILAEMSQPKTVVKQIGNTIFSVQDAQNKVGIFRVFNADIDQNLLSNTKLFCAFSLHSLGFNYLITPTDDIKIFNLFQKIMQSPPMQDMSTQGVKLQDGTDHFILKLGSSGGAL